MHLPRAVLHPSGPPDSVAIPAPARARRCHRRLLRRFLSSIVSLLAMTSPSPELPLRRRPRPSKRVNAFSSIVRFPRPKPHPPREQERHRFVCPKHRVRPRWCLLPPRFLFPAHLPSTP